MNTFLKVLSFMTSSFILSDAATAKPLDEVLQRPLILGASVSEGYLTEGPGQVLARRYTEASQIKTLAWNGSPAVKTLRNTTSATFADRTAVIGVDLFFWDSIQSSAEPSLSAMRRLFAEVRAKNIPLVIGDIPNLLPSRQPQAATLNRELNRLCAKYENCFLVPLDRLARELIRNGGLEYEGRRYSFLQLLPDGLHVSAVGSQYLADEIGKLLKTRR